MWNILHSLSNSNNPSGSPSVCYLSITYGQLRAATRPNLHVFVLWQETGVSGGSLHTVHGDNGHIKATAP